VNGALRHAKPPRRLHASFTPRRESDARTVQLHKENRHVSCNTHRLGTGGNRRGNRGGITTRDPGFIIITFIGALVVPRVLGLAPRRRWYRRGFGPNAFGPHGKNWGGDCAGASRKGSDAEASTPVTQSV